MRVARLMLFIIALTTFSALTAETKDELVEQVRNSERAFAKTMADRDLDAFASFLASDAVFFGKDVLRGKSAVVAGWKSFYEGTSPPFSWRPDSIEVLDSGTLAHSSGPVFDPQGKQVGTFNSVWRRDADGQWQVVFDKGCDSCRCKT